MKNISKLKWVAGVFSVAVTVVWLTGCGNDNGEVVGGSMATTFTNAPTSIAGNAITHTITTGTSPFPASSIFVMTAGGNAGDLSGPFTITGPGVTNISGTFTFTTTSQNSASLILEGSSLGVVTESMIFQTPSSGTFFITAATGTEAGRFTLQ